MVWEKGNLARHGGDALAEEVAVVGNLSEAPCEGCVQLCKFGVGLERGKRGGKTKRENVCVGGWLVVCLFMFDCLGVDKKSQHLNTI